MGTMLATHQTGLAVREHRTHTFQEAYQGICAGYEASRTSRFLNRLRDVLPGGSGSDHHVREDRQLLYIIEQARQMDRDNMIVGQGVDRLVDNVIKEGINPKPQTGDTKLNQEILDRWTDWTGDRDQCHLAGELTFHDLAQLTLRSVIVDGDCAHIITDDGALEPIEAHRIRTPRRRADNIVNGVELDPRTRRRQAFWIIPENSNPRRSSREGSALRWPALDARGRRRILHVLDGRRFSQTRGISVLAPAFKAIGMHDDLQVANLMRAQIASCYAIIENPDIQTQTEGVVSDTGPTVTHEIDNFSRIIGDISPGMRYRAPAGTKLEGFAPNIPNPEFFEHATMVMTFIAINLKIPLAVLLLDPSKTNFSGWRGAIDQARIGFSNIQNWMIARFYGPIYRHMVQEWFGDRSLDDKPGLVEADGVPAIQLLKVKWQRPGWNYIEPGKDIAADVDAVANGMGAPSTILAVRGRVWNDETLQGAKDIGFAIRTCKEEAKSINEQFPDDPDKVGWRDIVRLPTAKGTTMKLVPTTEGGGDDDKV